MKNMRILAFAFVVLFFFLGKDISMAAVYDCHTTQAFQWRHGRLRPYAPYRHSVFQFDDKNGVLSAAIKSGYPAGFSKQKILSALNPSNNLVAFSTLIINGQFVENTLFRLNKQNKAGNFAFLYSSGNEVASGHCIISQALKSLPSPTLQGENHD